MPCPEDIGVYSKTTDPYQDLWGLLVILLNIPVLLIGAGLLVHFFGVFGAMIIYGPWVLTPVWNIQNVLARWRDPLAKVKWWKLAVTCNLYIGLFGISAMVDSPGKVLPVPMILASLTGINLARSMAEKNKRNKGFDKEISGPLKLLIPIVIALNTLLLLFMLLMIANNFRHGGMIFAAPLLIIAALNISTALKIRKNIQACISWHRWIVFGNILVGLFGLTYLLPGKHYQLMLGISLIAIALTGTTLIMLLSHDRSSEKSADKMETTPHRRDER